MAVEGVGCGGRSDAPVSNSHLMSRVSLTFSVGPEALPGLGIPSLRLLRQRRVGPVTHLSTEGCAARG